MKFTRRGVTDDVPPEVPAAPDTAPRGHPVAAFAGILDGRSLWLAFEARPGTPALRDATSGDVLALPHEPIDDQPAYRGARLDLAALPATDATYDVVVVPPGGRSAQPVWTPRLGDQNAPPPGDGCTQHTLQRAVDGTLQVRRTTLPPAATLRLLSVQQDGFLLTLDGGGPTLAILNQDDAVLGSWPANGDAAVITCDVLDGLEPQVTRVVSGEPGAWLPVRRRANDMADPRRAALLPQHHDQDAEEPRMRLRWSPQAMLQLRIIS